MMSLLLLDGGGPPATVTTGGCFPPALAAAHFLLAVVDGAIAAVAVVQLLRMCLQNQQLGWTRQKIFHMMIGSSNLGYLLYFILSLVATCQRWRFWSHGLGFILMAWPEILFLAAFLLLLSFWVDLCHQSNDEEDEESSYTEPLLEKTKTQSSLLRTEGHRRWYTFRNIHIGSRQKFVILVIVLIFAFMIAFALLIWVGRGRNPIDSTLVAKVYLGVFSVATLILGGALACYGGILSLKMRNVRSDMFTSEMWKVASLAAVSLICFTSSSIINFLTNIPLEVLSFCHSGTSNGIYSSIFIFLYYFIGSSVPSGFVLWVMRQIPRRRSVERPSQTTIVTIIRDSQSAPQNPQWRTTVASSQSKALKASPI